MRRKLKAVIVFMLTLYFVLSSAVSFAVTDPVLQMRKVTSLGEKIDKVNEDADYVYVIGNYAFTSIITLDDIRMATNNNAENVSIYCLEKTYNGEFEKTGWIIEGDAHDSLLALEDLHIAYIDNVAIEAQPSQPDVDEPKEEDKTEEVTPANPDEDNKEEATPTQPSEDKKDDDTTTVEPEDPKGEDDKKEDVTPVDPVKPGEDQNEESNPTKPEVDEHEHQFTEWKTIVEPNCRLSRNKVEERTCEICGEKEKKETQPEHHLVRAEELDVPATCTKMGAVYSVCDNVCDGVVCGQEFFHVEPALGHKWEETKSIDKNVTCTEDGLKSFHCLREGCTETKEPEVIEAIGHDWKQYHKAATCTENGMNVQYCNNCGETIKTIIEEEKATGHTFGEYVSDGNANCENDGTMTKTCSSCGATDTIVESGTKKPHVFVSKDNRVEPTCTKNGKEADEVCINCGTIKTGAVLSAVGHDLEYIHTSKTSSRCTGSTTLAKCSRCDFAEIEYETFFGTGHQWDPTGRYCVVCCGEDGEQAKYEDGRKDVWWEVWKSGTPDNIKSRSGAIWFVGFKCDLADCEGYLDEYGHRVATTKEGRRGDTEKIEMKAPQAKQGLVFEGWYELSTGRKITEDDLYTKVKGDTIYVHWRDMYKGYEARYTQE